MTDKDKIRSLEVRLDRLEHVLIHGAPMPIADQMLCEAIERGDRKTVAIWMDQQGSRRSP